MKSGEKLWRLCSQYYADEKFKSTTGRKADRLQPRHENGRRRIMKISSRCAWFHQKWAMRVMFFAIIGGAAPRRWISEINEKSADLLPFITYTEVKISDIIGFIMKPLHKYEGISLSEHQRRERWWKLHRRWLGQYVGEKVSSWNCIELLGSYSVVMAGSNFS